MEEGVRPARRVLTGNDEHGRSRVVLDGPAPNTIGAPQRPGGGMLDLWVFHTTPAPLSGKRDDGNLPYSFEPPRSGAHLRCICPSCDRPNSWRDLDSGDKSEPAVLSPESRRGIGRKDLVL